ncbi:glycine betaine ABC transporter substrate-binding protein [soil metagenome]
MSPVFAQAFSQLPGALGGHVLVSACALLLAAAISLPLAVVSVRSPRLRWIALAGASLIQTIPSLALLALFYPLLLLVSAAAKATSGHGFPALGFLPALLALTLYAILPMLRNAVAGLTGVDPAVLEAADGVGMTAGQKFRRVQAPLAAPVVMAGVRNAATWTIGAATLATAVGQTSLGDYIFSGLQTESWALVLFGCAASAALALTVDGLLALVEVGLKRRDRARVAVGLGLLSALLIAAIAPAVAGSFRPKAYVIGAKNFSEQYILADLMASRLERESARVAQKSDLGSAIAFRALAANDLDAYVDYSGTLWSNVLKRTDTPPRAELLKELTAELKRRYGVTVLGSLGFENAYALAMRRADAERLHVTSLADLGPHAPELSLGSDLEFLSRPEWKALSSTYSLKFRSERRFQPTFMYRAVAGREVDVISAFSSDGRIAALDLVTLADPKAAAPSYDAVVLLSPARAADAKLRRALTPLVGRIDVTAMRRANLAVDRDEHKISPVQAAADLARSLGL